MRRRLDLAASLIMRPRTLFLAEPATGLDPRGRTEVWNAVRSLVDGGTTVLLSTPYLEEADQLADRVCVIHGGRTIADGTADGTSDELKARLGGDRIEVVPRDVGQLPAVATVVGRAARSGEVETAPDHRRLGARVTDRIAALTETVRALAAAGIGAEDIVLRHPTLDEVFPHLTGERAVAETAATETAEQQPASSSRPRPTVGPRTIPGCSRSAGRRR